MNVVDPFACSASQFFDDLKSIPGKYYYFALQNP